MESTKEALRAPAIALLVNMGGAIAILLFAVFGSALGMTLGGMGMFGDADIPEKMFKSGVNIASSITGIGVCAYIAWSMLQMLKLKHYTHAVVSCVLACIPCFTFLCCITSLPFAIWALVVLRRPDVRAAFS